MKLFDEKFKDNKLRYIAQCCLAAVSMFAILSLLKALSNAALIAALGASSFIVFVVPHAQAARARFLIGGYVVGVVVGSACYWLGHLLNLPEQFAGIPNFQYVVLGAAAVGLSTFAMVITNSEHPPAAGLALGFVLMPDWKWMTLIVVLAGIVALSLVKALLKPLLRNLL